MRRKRAVVCDRNCAVCAFADCVLGESDLDERDFALCARLDREADRLAQAWQTGKGAKAGEKEVEDGRGKRF